MTEDEQKKKKSNLFKRSDLSHEVEKLIHQQGALPPEQRVLTYDMLMAIGVNVQGNPSHRQMVLKAFEYAKWDARVKENYGYLLSTADTTHVHAARRWRAVQNKSEKVAIAVDNLLTQHEKELPPSYVDDLRRGGMIAKQIAGTSTSQRKQISAAPSQMYLGAIEQEKMDRKKKD